MMLAGCNHYAPVLVSVWLLWLTIGYLMLVVRRRPVEATAVRIGQWRHQDQYMG